MENRPATTPELADDQRSSFYIWPIDRKEGWKVEEKGGEVDGGSIASNMDAQGPARALLTRGVQ